MTTFQCGNGQLDPAETCDDGNFEAGDGCDPRCNSECGNGNIDQNETCDDGNLSPNDGCTDACELARCGDGIIWLGNEDCDAGEDNSDDPGAACRTDCTVAECGDGIVDPGEDCDDENDVNTDACTNACTNARCGDGIIGPGEECDGDASCQPDCTSNSNVRRIDLNGVNLRVTLAESSVQSCAAACGSIGAACDQDGLTAMANYVGSSTGNYDTLVKGLLGLRFSNGPGTATMVNSDGSPNYLGVGCSSGTWNFRGFTEPISDCGNNQFRTAPDSRPTCDTSGYTDGNFSGPRICACR